MSRFSNFLHRKKEKKGGSAPQSVLPNNNTSQSVSPSVPVAVPLTRPAPPTTRPRPRPSRPAPPPPLPLVPPRPVPPESVSTVVDFFGPRVSGSQSVGETHRRGTGIEPPDSQSVEEPNDGGTGVEVLGSGTGVEPHGSETGAQIHTDGTGAVPRDGDTIVSEGVNISSSNDYIFGSLSDFFNELDSTEQEQRTRTRPEATPSRLNPFNPFETDESDVLTDFFTSLSESNLANIQTQTSNEEQRRTASNLSASAVSLDSSIERAQQNPGWHPLILPGPSFSRPNNAPPPPPSRLPLERTRPVPKRRSRLPSPPLRPAAPAWFPHPSARETAGPKKPPHVLPVPETSPVATCVSLDAQCEDEMMEHLSCPICLNLYTNPVVFPCLHSLCHSCMENFKAAKLYFNCPECREVIKEKDIKKNFPLQSMVEAYTRDLKSRKMGSLSSLNALTSDLTEPEVIGGPNVQEPQATGTQCSICEFSAKRSASYKCVQCKMAFCRSCLHDYHPTIESTPEHTIQLVL